MFKSLIIFISLFIILFLGCVTPSNDPPPENTPVVKPSPPLVVPQPCEESTSKNVTVNSINSCDAGCYDSVLSFTLLADSNLPEDHKMAVASALAEWDIKTGSVIDYRIVFTDMSKESDDVNTFVNTYKLYIKPLDGLLGWTVWVPWQNGAAIIIVPGTEAELFRIVLLHELGHAFNLRFANDSTHYEGKFKSIMHAWTGSTVECPDLIAFCKLYSCKINCLCELSDEQLSEETIAPATLNNSCQLTEQ